MKIEGKGNISAEIIADSISSVDGKRITTFVLEYPRFIHSEFMTHRMISKNSASSRAIPVAKMIELVQNSPAMPVHWGKNQPGMQAKEEVANIEWHKQQWKNAAREVTLVAEDMTNPENVEFGLGVLHKQVANRLLEPFQMMRVVATATEWNNFFHLRLHEDAQPEIHELARVMKQAKDESKPEELHPGEWHTPFVDHDRLDNGELRYSIIDDKYMHVLTLEEALKVSASCCAQVSFRKGDNSLVKAIDIYTRLVDSKPVHASPFEHQATPMQEYTYEWKNPNACTIKHINAYEMPRTWQEGITHSDRKGKLWSGNFQGFVQYRQLIKDNAVYG